MIHSEDGATRILSPALRYLPSHSSSYRTIPSVPLPGRRWRPFDARAICLLQPWWSASGSLFLPSSQHVDMYLLVRMI